MKHQKFTLKERMASFSYAFNGLKIMLSREPNAWIHSCAAILAVFLGIWLDISAIEWLSIVVVIGIVFATELINTAIENMADIVSPEKNEKIGLAKDAAAAAVLVCSIMALLVGSIVFLPKLIFFFRYI